jgi:hypothetical protein
MNLDKLVAPTQKFIIKPDGTIVIDWVSTEFSDVIIDALYSKEERQQLLDLNNGVLPKIYCG